MTTIEKVRDVLDETYKDIATENIGCICYVFNRNASGCGTGFNSENCDVGDVMILVRRLMEMFD